MQEARKDGIITDLDLTLEARPHGDAHRTKAGNAAIPGLKHVPQEDGQVPAVASVPQLPEHRAAFDSAQLESVAAGRTTTTSSEDYLAGLLMDAVASGDGPDQGPQSVLPTCPRTACAKGARSKSVSCELGKPQHAQQGAFLGLGGGEAGTGVDLQAMLVKSEEPWPLHTGARLLSPPVLDGLVIAPNHDGDGLHSVLGSVDADMDWERLTREFFT